MVDTNKTCIVPQFEVIISRDNCDLLPEANQSEINLNTKEEDIIQD